jgi:uncharacterized protein (TIGR00661 family)
MHQILSEAGHECVAALTGKSKFRKLPGFFTRYFESKISEFESPNFIRDKENKSIRILPSLFYNLFRCGRYFRSIRNIHHSITELKPDLIISFYEPLTGLYRFFYRSHIPCISVAHQFATKYTDYISGGSMAEVFAIRLLTTISAYGSEKLFCIYPEEKMADTEQKIVFIPPLIRKEIKQATISDNESIACYLLNSGYKSELIDWHKSRPEVIIHCFTDDIDEPEENYGNLFFHRIEGNSYVKHLASCKALATTAGYESVCEAMFLGKAVLMVPVKNHYEQHLNSIFFERFGAGIRSDFFDIDKLLNFTTNFNPIAKLKDWTEKGSAIIEKEISELIIKKAATR